MSIGGRSVSKTESTQDRSPQSEIAGQRLHARLAVMVQYPQSQERYDLSASCRDRGTHTLASKANHPVCNLKHVSPRLSRWFRSVKRLAFSGKRACSINDDHPDDIWHCGWDSYYFLGMCAGHECALLLASYIHAAWFLRLHDFGRS